ncbi:hypothetical protein [Pseudomonas sp. P105]|uniref:hypothetical protein n=1 Tax=Pseudomonas sp. P105 TaxID=3049542 RepID=UPI0029345C37|nr:hypothetical protein [Pseudomonas sp. P105]WNZ80908.1 hypothetical protein QOM08_12690 [Pseudomonas sp. P105]
MKILMQIIGVFASYKPLVIQALLSLKVEWSQHLYAANVRLVHCQGNEGLHPLAQQVGGLAEGEVKTGVAHGATLIIIIGIGD